MDGKRRGVSRASRSPRPRVAASLLIACAVLSGCGSRSPASTHRSSAPTTVPSQVVSTKSPAPAPPPSVIQSVSPPATDLGSGAIKIDPGGQTWGTSGCPDSSTALQQSADGRFSQCLQVDAVPAGEYTVVLEQISSGPIGLAPTNPVLPGLTLSASPASAPPGTTITITGTLAVPLPSKPASAQLCWDGCPDGLSYLDTDLQWLSPTVFRTTIVAPTAPWVSSNPPQVAPLVSGDYTIGVRCLEDVQACGVGGAEATTTFHLDVRSSAGPHWCFTSDSCAQLTVSPRRALPGQQIMITGFAPVTSMGAGGHPFAFQLQVVPGAPSGPTVRFEPLGDAGGTAEYFGFGGLTVAQPPTFASLNSAGWLPHISNGWQPITVNPAVPDTTAWCGPGAITVSTQGHTREISTNGVQAALKATGLPAANIADAATAPTCDTLAALGSGIGGAPAIVAGFGVDPGDQEPFSAEVALMTRDAGQSWTPVPVPHGVRPYSFGGFRYQHGEVVALFDAIASSAQRTSSTPAVEATADAGGSWRAANLACPERGPCITFGPFQDGNCAKNAAGQSIISSPDDGRHWVDLQDFGACYSAQLVAATDGSEIFLNTGDTLTMQRSIDNGRTWQDIELPPLPGQQSAYDSTIFATPTGSLMALGPNPPETWLLLRPGATSWCNSRTPAADLAFPGGPTVLGDQLWWLATGSGGSGSVPGHVAAADVTC